MPAVNPKALTVVLPTLGFLYNSGLSPADAEKRRDERERTQGARTRKKGGGRKND